MRCGVNSRLVPLLLVCLTFSLPLLDVAYASPGTRVIGCRAMFGVAWSIVAIIGWENAGALLLILIDLYRAVGGSRVGRLQDSVSGTGSKEYAFDPIQGGREDRFIIDVQYYDSIKQDYVHNPDRIGMLECPRPAAQTETTTLTVTTLSTTNVTERETVTVQVHNPPSELDPRALVWMTWVGFGFVAGIILGAIIVWLYLRNIRWGAPPTPPPQNKDFGA